MGVGVDVGGQHLWWFFASVVLVYSCDAGHQPVALVLAGLLCSALLQRDEAHSGFDRVVLHGNC